MTRTAVGTESNWFDDDEIRELRRKLPILYIDVVPVRLDPYGAIKDIGLLLRADGSGRIIRSLVSGRVLVHESLREAIIRHVEKDLGTVALPKVPTSMVPFTVAEYFTYPGPVAVCGPAPARGFTRLHRSRRGRLCSARRCTRSRMVRCGDDP